MDLGLFMEFHRREGCGQAEAFEESFQYVQAAEEEGLDSVWLAEVHFAPERSVLSAPLTLASAIAARTKRLKVGIAVSVLPLGNPVRMAEETATLDHISQGRFELGVGRSGLPRGYIGYNISYAESRGRFLECLEVLKRAWTQERFSYQGQFYSFHDVCVVPKPLQRPYPPIRIAANSPDTYGMVGHMGHSLFIGLRGVNSRLKERVQQYREAWQETGHAGKPDVSLRVPVYVAETAEQARREPEASTLNFYHRMTPALGEPLPGLSEEANKERAQRAERMKNITYDEILKTDVAYGTPERVVERLQELREDFGLSGVVAEINLGGLIAPQNIANSMRLFATEVVPRLK